MKAIPTSVKAQFSTMKTELKRELTLQDLAPYLPYGLKGMAEFIKVGFKPVELIGFSRFALLVDRGEGVDEYCHIIDFKPLLIPVSELNTIIPSIDKVSTPMQILRSRFNYPSLKSIKYNFVYRDVEGYFDCTNQAIGYSVFRQLHEWNIDTSGLLDAGLALNKNEYPNI